MVYMFTYLCACAVPIYAYDDVYMCVFVSLYVIYAQPSISQMS